MDNAQALRNLINLIQEEKDAGSSDSDIWLLLTDQECMEGLLGPKADALSAEHNRVCTGLLLASDEQLIALSTASGTI